jgi:signal transduction histidine kinase
MCLYFTSAGYSKSKVSKGIQTDPDVTAQTDSASEAKSFQLVNYEEEFLYNLFHSVGLANELFANEQYDELFTMYRDILKKIVSETDPCNLFIYHNVLSQLQYRQQSSEDYIQTLQNAYAISHDCDLMRPGTKHSLQVGVLNNLIHIYKEINDYPSALSIAEEAEKVMQEWTEMDAATERKTGIEMARAVFSNNLANIYYQLNQPEIAEVLWLDNIRYLRDSETSEIQLAAIAQIGVASIYIDRQQSEPALPYLTEAEKILQKFPDENIDRMLTDAYRRYYESLGDIEKAYQYLIKTAETDKILSDRAENLRELNTEYEISFLEKEIETSTLKQQSDSRLIIALTGFSAALILGVTLWTVWYREKILERDYKNLQFSTKVILRQNDQLNRSAYNIRKRLSHFTHDLHNVSSGLSYVSRNIVDSDSADQETRTLADAIQQSLNLFDKFARESAANTTGLENGVENRRPIDCKTLLNNLKQLITPLLMEKHQSLIIEGTDSTHLKTDENKVTRILINLIENASKFSPEHSRIWVTFTSEGDRGCFIVEDEGPGISESVMEHLFESEVFESNEYSSDKPSSGLGLYIARLFTEELRGSIEVSNSKNTKHGARFEVHIPLC